MADVANNWFLLAVLMTVAGGYAVFTLYLVRLRQTLALVRPAFRGDTARYMWLCLFPVLGWLHALTLVTDVAACLAREFRANGGHRPGDTYGQTSGLLWAAGPFVVLTATCVMPCLLGQRMPLWLPVVLGIIGLVSVGGFVKHWMMLENCRHRLAQYDPATQTQDERDYADDDSDGGPP